MKHGPTSHTFFSQRLKLHYVDWGNPDAPPLILQHGGLDHCRSWDWIARELSEDWHVIAPDLRGHGDSEWSSDGEYSLRACVYDFAQLIHQKKLSPVTIIGHSYGGNISLRYTGLYPENVRKLVAIEGLGPSPKIIAEREAKPIDEKVRSWIDKKREISSRLPKRYESIDAAMRRMLDANKHLSEDQARHLTIHGVNQNEDGSWSWKYDNYFRIQTPYEMAQEDLNQLWQRITCPTLLIYGADSWASNPEKDGRIANFNTAKVEEYENAGHWAHHDQFDRFMSDIREFL
ncbi:MAG: alpha/beta hydrolase [Ponticaulis sp.]|nr:alpha/beta hydrolase [Ponticaulis sp.]